MRKRSSLSERPTYMNRLESCANQDDLSLNAHLPPIKNSYKVAQIFQNIGATSKS
jgi:hypothetical protein